MLTGSCCHVAQVTPIDVLPDDVLLAYSDHIEIEYLSEIFDFYVVRISLLQRLKRDVELWQSLVHVCRRWRCVVFGSPRRLNLRLVCTPGTPARERLDVWLALPLVIESIPNIFSTSADNIVAPGHSDRICRIDIQITDDLEWDILLAAMQMPFPALTHFLLRCDDIPEPAIPDTFFGGSAPRLQYLRIEGIPFPGIPKLLLNVTRLVHLYLRKIPDAGYISPEAMSTCLSVLTSLNTLYLGFQLYSRSPPVRESRRPPPITRTTLPDLISFRFKGASEYLDHLVARIDTPRLQDLSMNFPPRMNFDTPNLVHFISRTPKFQEPNEARVRFGCHAKVQLFWAFDRFRSLCMKISCEEVATHLPSFAQACTMCLPPLSTATVEILRLGDFVGSKYRDPYPTFFWKYDVEEDHWLEVLRPFTAVKSLCLSEELHLNIAFALQELVGGRMTEVLPSLQGIFLDTFEPPGSFQEVIEQFVTARQLSGHPIAVLPL